MININEIKSSSDLTSYITKANDESSIVSQKENLKLSNDITKQFINSILEDTLTNREIKHVYEYPINPDCNSKELQIHIENMIYTILNKNIYALPDIFVKMIEAENQRKLFISAPTTIECINSTDIRLVNDISSFIDKNAGVISSGSSTVYTGFEHISSVLGSLYGKSRSKFISCELQKKGYNAHFESDNMYLVISAK